MRLLLRLAAPFALAALISGCAATIENHTPSLTATAEPGIFPSQSIHSSDTPVFGQWTEVTERYADEQQNCAAANDRACDRWLRFVDSLKSEPLDQRVEDANEYLNAVAYVTTSQNWGETTHWETPFEFLARGGQCQDYAIAKYLALAGSGVPESDMRFVVVRDLERQLDHAILVVTVDGKDVVLDNQRPDIRPLADVSRYRAYYAINDQGWWVYFDSPVPGVQVASTH